MNQLTTQQLNRDLDTSVWPIFNKLNYIQNDGEQIVKCEVRIDPNLNFFKGHFPEQPVVPGVIQVHWVGELSQRIFKCVGFSSLKKVKFSNTMLPADTVQLVLKHNQQSGNVNFEYFDEDQSFSTGVISFQ